MAIDTVKYWVEKFEKDYRAKNTLSDRTWLQYFNTLDPSQPLTEALLIEAVLSKKANTAQRKSICIKLQALAKCAGVHADLTKYRGKSRL